VKATIRELEVSRCESLAQEALSLAGADEVRKLVLRMLAEDSH
jgi:phosphoenolpyruvate-protein kinase (PTS system EI component)